MRLASIAVLASFMNVGCYSTYHLTPQSLQSLDGYREGDKRVIHSDGDSVVIDRDTQLYFVGAHSESTGTLASVHVDGDTLHATTRPSGEQVAIDLKEVRAIHARRFSEGKTIAAIVIPSVLVTVVGVIAFAAFSSGSCIGLCGMSWH